MKTGLKNMKRGGQFFGTFGNSEPCDEMTQYQEVKVVVSTLIHGVSGLKKNSMKSFNAPQLEEYCFFGLMGMDLG